MVEYVFRVGGRQEEEEESYLILDFHFRGLFYVFLSLRPVDERASESERAEEREKKHRRNLPSTWASPVKPAGQKSAWGTKNLAPALQVYLYILHMAFRLVWLSKKNCPGRERERVIEKLT